MEWSGGRPRKAQDLSDLLVYEVHELLLELLGVLAVGGREHRNTW
jgi:hypothetical protein